MLIVVRLQRFLQGINIDLTHFLEIFALVS